MIPWFIWLSINPLIICLTESGKGISEYIIYVSPISQILCFINEGNYRCPNMTAFVEIVTKATRRCGKLAITQRKLSYEKQGQI